MDVIAWSFKAVYTRTLVQQYQSLAFPRELLDEALLQLKDINTYKHGVFRAVVYSVRQSCKLQVCMFGVECTYITLLPDGLASPDETLLVPYSVGCSLGAGGGWCPKGASPPTESTGVLTAHIPLPESTVWPFTCEHTRGKSLSCALTARIAAARRWTYRFTSELTLERSRSPANTVPSAPPRKWTSWGTYRHTPEREWGGTEVPISLH